MSFLTKYNNGHISFAEFLSLKLSEENSTTVSLTREEFRVIIDHNDKAVERECNLSKQNKDYKEKNLDLSKDLLVTKKQLFEVLDTAIELTDNQYSFGALALGLDMRALRSELDHELGITHSVQITVDGKKMTIPSNLKDVVLKQWRKESRHYE